ncbi:MAG: TonB-dependent receptor [Bacteroidales bacterium]|nr:TonB-dependent receptor [Bacteroidales bacterium]
MNRNNINAAFKACAVCACLFSAGSLFAQSYNPTVEVTRKYKGTLPETKKPEMEMAVPDSLLKLKLDFDYSVFDTPYQGAYEFKPYRLDMKPQPDAYTGRELYLKGGLGYAFRPEFRAVYSPELKGRFRFSLHGLHDSYFGNFRTVNDIFGAFPKTYSGRDANTVIGADARVDMNKAILTFGLDWKGLSTKDTLLERSYSAVDFKARLRSNNDAESYFFYDGVFEARMGSDKYKDNMGKVGFTEIHLGGEFGPVLNPEQAIIVTVDSDIANYVDLFESHVSTVSLAPQWRFVKDRLKFGLGGRISARAEGNNGAYLIANHQKKLGFIRPDVYISYEAVYDKLFLYSYAKGGYDINSYSSILEKNHFFNAYSGRYSSVAGGSALLDNTDIVLDYAAGLKGNFSSKFTYDLRFGFRDVDGGLFETLYYRNDVMLPGIVYASYKQIFGEVNLGWKSEKWLADASLAFRNNFMDDKGIELFEPAKMSGNISAMYLFHARAKAGVTAEFAAKRTRFFTRAAQELEVPGYLDLGLYGEYQYNRKLSFWAKGFNLLNADIQRNVGYVEGGIGFTVGAIFSL